MDNAGNAYITGYDAANIGGSNSYPTTAGALQTTPHGSWQAIVAKVNTTLSGSASLAYSTYLGGSGNTYGYGIALDNSGNAYITGATASSDFPTVNAYQTSNPSGTGSVAFVSKLNATGSALLYSTYLGGSGGEDGFGIAVDTHGNAYVTGDSCSTDFPTTATAFQRTPATVNDCTGYVSKLNTTTSGTASLVYSTYLGGSGSDEGLGIAVDTLGDAYLTGQTHSRDFPTANPFQGSMATTTSGAGTAFVTSLNASGSALLYSTYLGGSGGEQGTAITLDPAGNAYVTGWTASTNFPTTHAYSSTYGGGQEDAFVAKIVPYQGPSNAGSNSQSGIQRPPCTGDPINCATGDFSHSFTDLAVPGRGLPLQFMRTYDALNAAQDGPLGFGCPRDAQ